MSNRGRDRATQLVVAEVSVDFIKHTLLSSAREYEQRDRANNCNRHSQGLQRSQLSDKGRDRARQLVGVKISVDFTKHTLLSSAKEDRETAQTTEL